MNSLRSTLITHPQITWTDCRKSDSHKLACNTKCKQKESSNGKLVRYPFNFEYWLAFGILLSFFVFFFFFQLCYFALKQQSHRDKLHNFLVFIYNFVCVCFVRAAHIWISIFFWNANILVQSAVHTHAHTKEGNYTLFYELMHHQHRIYLRNLHAFRSYSIILAHTAKKNLFHFATHKIPQTPLSSLLSASSSSTSSSLRYELFFYLAASESGMDSR